MYVFMNAGAFIAAAAIAQRLTGPTDAGMSLGVDKMVPTSAHPRLNTINGDDIRQYAGLSRGAPLLAGTMLVFLLSLTGIPLTIGFATKIKLFTLLFNISGPIGMLGIAAVGVNTVIGAFYYFRIIRHMYLTESDAPRLIEIAPVSVLAMVFIAPNILFFIAYGWVDNQSERHARILTTPAPLVAEQPTVDPAIPIFSALRPVTDRTPPPMPSLPSMLINLHRAEGASLFRYLTDSPSYISPIANRWMPTVRALGQAANEQLHQLEAFLEATGENSNPVSFPGNFASLHYTSMDYLFGRLLADKRGAGGGLCAGGGFAGAVRWRFRQSRPRRLHP